MYAVLALNLVFEIVMTVYIFKNEMLILNELGRIYKRYWHLEQFRKFFEVTTCSVSVINVLIYIHGCYAIYSHKVTNYQIFLAFLMLAIFVSILLTYLNVLNLLLFVMKCFTYVFTRYVLSELYTVLIIPPNDHIGGLEAAALMDGLNHESPAH